ncbi:BLUF domain-containing protein [Tropicimonas sp. TH_r6]|uniref:BLUF domain-containing protein n=1 Tax=Tropicimonas sp. TH_r6 TaxID=3082085 RepID=UPI0029538676|nr:BLUF domain-containing protein [Tropicimonas sp. TH_r6]MDV7144805.1 BLUF domain-containing protein [Tropicimonas sp. TH_r6]
MEWLIYVSKAVVSPASQDAASIYLTARQRNKTLGLTGYLHREDGVFMQYLEGPSEGIDTLLLRLRRDWRHRDMRILHRAPLEQRRFPGWNMEFTESPKGSFAHWAAAADDRKPLSDVQLDQVGAEDLLAFIESIRDAAPD